MRPNYKRIKTQIKADETVVNATIEKINHIQKQKRIFPFKQVSVLAASICLVLTICLALPLILQIAQEDLPTDTVDGTQETGINSDFNDPSVEDPIQGAQSYNDGVTISEALSQIIAKSSNDETILVKLQAIDLIDVYAVNYVDRLYDGKTYDEWWAEYEVYTSRMIEIEAQLKLGPDTELENEYNTVAEKAEDLAAYMSQIQKKQKSESVANELEWLKSLGIEAEYKGGYFIFSASSDDIKNISKGKCNYFIDVESDSKEPVEEIH